MLHSAEALAESRRKEIFRHLVSDQEMPMTREESHEYICYRFGVTEPVVWEIQQEGLAAGWLPPSSGGGR